MKDKRKIGVYLIAPGLIILIYGIIFFVRGIFPFGNENISYYDMAQLFVPMYEHGYDVLHGDKSVWFNWFTGAGEGMVGSAGWYVLHPINWILYFVPQGKILQFMSLFLLIKLVFCSVTMQLYLEKKFGTDVSWGWKVLFAFLYANSGYVLQFYTNIFFLDAVWLFPLIMWALERMLEQKKMIMYTVLMTLSLTFSIYFSFMILIYILLSSFGYLFLCVEKKERGDKIVRLGVSTIVALGLSAWMWIPCVIQMINSSRMQMAGRGYTEIITQTANILQAQKEWHLFGTEIAIAIILVGGVRFFIKNKKLGKYYLYMLILMIVPIWIESIDLLWHTGSYVMFPMRFGFMTVFLVLTAAMHIIKEKCFAINCKKEIIALFTYFFAPIYGIMIGYFFYDYMKRFTEFGIADLLNYDLTVFFMCMYVICYLIWCIRYTGFKEKIRYVSLFLVISIQMIIGICVLIAPRKMYSVETDDYFVQESNELREAWAEELEGNNFARIKCADTSLNVNYPLLLKYPAISSWTNASNANMPKELTGMGYASLGDNRLLDAGGTVFSDALLGYDKAFAKGELDNNLYAQIASYEEYNLYNREYVFPQGIFVGEEFLDLRYDAERYQNSFEYQNEIFKRLTGIESDLIQMVELGEPDSVEMDVNLTEEYQGYNRFTYRIPNTGEKIVYLYLEREQLTHHVVIENEDGIKVFRFLTLTSSALPFYGNNNLIEVMTIDGDIELKLCTYMKELNGGCIGILNVELLAQYIDNGMEAAEELKIGKRSIDFYIQAKQDGYVFLPVGHDEGWSAEVNEQNVAIESCMGNSFMLVPVQEGANTVHMSYFPKGMKLGIGISAFFLVIFFVLQKEDMHMIKSNICQVVFCITYSLVGIVILSLLYVIPMMAWIIEKIRF